MYEWLPGQAEIVKKYNLESSGIEVNFAFFPPASEAEIVYCEQKLGLKFPFSHRQFLLEFNGAELYDFEDSSIAILSLSSIYQVTLRAREMMSWEAETDQYPIIAFAYMEGLGDFLSFFSIESNSGEYPVLESFHDCPPSEWEQIAPSFDNWLRNQFNLTV